MFVRILIRLHIPPSLSFSPDIKIGEKLSCSRKRDDADSPPSLQRARDAIIMPKAKNFQSSSASPQIEGEYYWPLFVREQLQSTLSKLQQVIRMGFLAAV